MPAKLDIKKERQIKVTNFEIEHEDVFHLKNLYKRVYDWLVDEGWSAADGKDDKNFETLYWQRTNQSDASDHHVWWRAYRIPENNTYYRYFLKIDFQTLNMKKIEVMHKGQKFGTNKGDVIIRVVAFLQLDYKNEWDDDKLLKPVHTWFRKRAYAEEIESYKKDLFDCTYRLHTMIKQYLQFRPTVADWGRPFHHPDKGL